MNLKTTVKKETLTKAVVLLLALVAVPVYGAAVTKSGTGTDLTLGASWSGAVVPGTNDVATWDTGSLGAGLTLNAGTPSWQGLKINAGASDPLAIGSGGTLTLGTAGIDMSAAAVNATISSGLTLGAGNQTWTVNTGRTLTQNTGTFGRSAGATLLWDKSTVTGTVTASPTLVNSVTPWAIIRSSGTAANNSANGYTFATVTSGNLVPYTAATAVTTGYPANSAAVNYDWSSTGAQALIGSSRAANTIRFTGAAAVVQQSNSGQTETFNALMNTGGGTVTLGGGQTFNIQSATGELVLAAMTSGIIINGPIINNGTTPGVVTIAGPNTVTLGGASTFTGNLNVNNGTLAAGLGLGSISDVASQGSALGNLGTGTARSINVNNGGTLSLTGGNVLGTGGSANTLSAVTLVVNNGGVFQNGANAAGAGWWNKVGAVNLNGGTINVGSGANNGAFQGLALIGTVTVGGSTASLITNLPSSDNAFNAVHLGQNATANQSITFNVADVTGNANADLTIATKLINTSANLASSGLTKTGAGTLTLSASNSYTGSTVISNGVLALAGSGSLASTNVFVVSGAKFDVSGSSYSLGANQSLAGSGVVTGSVTSASSTSILNPGGNNVGDVGTLTFNNNLNLSAGSVVTFDLSTTAGSGNDQIVVGGNLTLSSSGAIHINALAGSLATANYVLCSVAGSTTMATTPALVWDGSVPANSANYTLQKIGNNLVLQYSVATAPSISTASVTPSPAFRNQPVTVSANVAQGSGSIVSVTVDASQIGGSAVAPLVQDASQLPSLVYTNTFLVSAGTSLGNKSLTIVATDNSSPTPLTGNFVLALTTVVDATVWTGSGSDAKWTSNNNWQSDLGPGYIGDSVTLAGSTQLATDMNTNYTLTSLTFDGSAGAFTIGSSASSTLTSGSGGIVNNSASPQTLNVPVVLNAAQTFNAAAGSLTVNANLSLGANALTLDGAADNTFAGVVSGTAGLTKNGNGSLVLSNANTFTGTLNLNAGTVVLANATALANNTVNFPANSTGTLNLRSDSDNIVVTNIQGSSGAGSSWTFSSDRATSGNGVNHTVGPVALPQATLNVTAGPNVTGGSPRVTTGPMNLSSGLSANVTINPTTADIAIARISAASVNKTLFLDGTSLGNEVIGNIDNSNRVITVTKQNSSTWTLSGANGFTGGVNLNGGTLVANNPAALGASGTVSFGGGTLKYGTNITADFSARFSTAAGQAYNLDLNGNNVSYLTALTSSGGTLTLNDTAASKGSLTLNATNNSFSGSTTVNGGKLFLATGVNGATFASDVTVAGSDAAFGVAVGAAGQQVVSSVSATLNSGGELAFAFGTVAPSGSVAPLSVNVLSLNSGLTLRVTGSPAGFVIGQSYPLATWISSGPGDATAFTTVVLPSRVVGNLSVSGSTLYLNVTGNTGPISWSTGNGTWNTVTANWVNALNVGTAFVDGSDSVVFGDASGASGNPIVTLNAALTPVTVLVNSAVHNYTLSGNGGIAGAAALTVQNGKVSVATTNTYTGSTIVNGGTLEVAGGGTLGAASGALTVSGGKVDLGTSTQTKGAVTISGGVITNGTLSGTAFAANNSGAARVDASLAGAGALTKTGNGVLTLTANNSLSGNLFAKSGTVVLDSGKINNGGNYSSIGVDTGDNATLTIKGTATFTNNADFNIGDLADSVGAVNVQDSGSLTVASLYIGSANAVGATASGVVNQTGGAVTQTSTAVGSFAVGGRTSASGVGVYNLSGGSLTAAGGIRVGGTGTGTVNISGSAVVNANGGFNIARIAGSTGTLNLNGGTVTTLNITSSTGVNCTNNFNGATVKPTGNNATWINALTQCNVRNGGAIFDTAGFNATVLQGLSHSDIAGDNAIDGGVTKNGLGTLTLSGTNSYTGNTTVNGGNLQLLQPSIATNSTVSVAGGATLQLDFTVTNDVAALVLGGVNQPGGIYNSNTSPTFITGAGSLRVPSSVNTTPTNIVATLSGGNLTLSWPADHIGWTLQVQTNSINQGLGTNWVDVTGSAITNSVTIPVNPANGSVFYRMKY